MAWCAPVDALAPGRYLIAAVDEALIPDWPAPWLLDRIARLATHVGIVGRETLYVNLSVIDP
jgi:hypothetical protein